MKHILTMQHKHFFANFFSKPAEVFLQGCFSAIRTIGKTIYDVCLLLCPGEAGTEKKQSKGKQQRFFHFIDL